MGFGGGSGPQLPLHHNFLASAAACCIGEIVSLPFDTAKVRLQLQGQAEAGKLVKYRGMFGTIATVAREEGPRALWKGLEPGIHRQCLFGGLRIGMYEPVRNIITGNNPDPPFLSKVAAGLFTGAAAIAIASPTDLVKVRMQAASQGTGPPKYPSAFKAYGMIAKEEGVMGLWKGMPPNVARNAVITSAEVATYDQIKMALIKTGYFEDNVTSHLVAGLGAGFFAVCCGSPVDVVKSRVMGDSTGQYKGVVDCFVKTFTNDGILAFYKGFGVNFLRLGSWNVVMFLSLEQIKARIFVPLNQKK